MLTEEMLAAPIEALGEVERLILCGDPRQLPPIGAGRPFADLVALLRETRGRRRRARRADDRPPPAPLDETDVRATTSRRLPVLDRRGAARRRRGAGPGDRRQRATGVRDPFLGRRARPAPQTRRPLCSCEELQPEAARRRGALFARFGADWRRQRACRASTGVARDRVPSAGSC